LLGLQHGSWSLPDPMPRSVLENFARRHGCVLRRCEDCRMGLPNGVVIFQTCPVCGSSRLSHKKISGPPWDPNYVYTPLTKDGKVSGSAVDATPHTSDAGPLGTDAAGVAVVGGRRSGRGEAELHLTRARLRV
jgi:hypothetical protein